MKCNIEDIRPFMQHLVEKKFVTSNMAGRLMKQVSTIDDLKILVDAQADIFEMPISEYESFNI
jgi:hypothetical protein